MLTIMACPSLSEAQGCLQAQAPEVHLTLLAIYVIRTVNVLHSQYLLIVLTVCPLVTSHSAETT